MVSTDIAQNKHKISGKIQAFELNQILHSAMFYSFDINVGNKTCSRYYDALNDLFWFISNNFSLFSGF